VGAATMLANSATFASMDTAISAPFSFIPLQGLHVGWLHGVVFGVGLAGCLCSHIAYISNARRKEQAVRVRLAELSLGLSGRRRA
jgi:hypothetical protein